MKQKWENIERRQSLRAQAETLVASLSPPGPSAMHTEVLLHELLVHKVELEMQNEALRDTEIALAEALARYTDLYEFAPVGYVTVDQDDTISAINLAGTALLGTERGQLIHSRFSKLIAPEDNDGWYLMFHKMMAAATTERHSFEMRLLRADGTQFRAHLDCLRRESADSKSSLRVALTDSRGD
ncbi:PAS domain S-box protein [Methylomonas methanica]|uniref:PAS/PAC sensor signal transduction histidine kinase n=1 Tax=Methylomonas methanica (strain DSM 25384 / MC09) TaxID=857087 RepID=G0A7G4_METMM|nr:PAS domain-containing protein [Methylomonas methanica]AEG00634.1 PAS/PAC sensor signal transduction histidine kinase [Methylomonas methanica MC09]